MNPPFSTIQMIAHDREEEIRKVASEYHRLGAHERASRPRLQERVALTLRGLADRLDPRESYVVELCAD